MEITDGGVPMLTALADAFAEVYATEEEALAAAAAALSTLSSEEDEEAWEAAAAEATAPPVSDTEDESQTAVDGSRLLVVPQSFGRRPPKYGKKYLEWLRQLFPTQTPYYVRQGHGLGALEVFPTEIHRLILASLDLKSLSLVRQTCSKASYLVQTLSEGRELQRVPTLIMALGKLGLLSQHPVSALVDATRSRYCECCLSLYNNEPERRWKLCVLHHPDAKARYGDLFLPTLDRVCLICYKNCRGSGRYRLMPENDAYRYFGLPPPTQLRFRLPWSPKQWRFEKRAHQLTVIKRARMSDYPKKKWYDGVSFAEVARLALQTYGSVQALHRAVWENMHRQVEQSETPWWDMQPDQAVPDHPESDIPMCLTDLGDWYHSLPKHGTYEKLVECTSKDQFGRPLPEHCLWPCWDQPTASEFDLEAEYPVHAPVPFFDGKGQEVRLLRCWGCFVNRDVRHYYEDAHSDHLMRIPYDIPLEEEDWFDHTSDLLYSAAELRQHQETCLATKLVREIIAVRERTIPPARSYWRNRKNHYVNIYPGIY